MNVPHQSCHRRTRIGLLNLCYLICYCRIPPAYPLKKARKKRKRTKKRTSPKKWSKVSLSGVRPVRPITTLLKPSLKTNLRSRQHITAQHSIATTTALPMHPCYMRKVTYGNLTWELKIRQYYITLLDNYTRQHIHLVRVSLESFSACCSLSRAWVSVLCHVLSQDRA